MKIQFIWEQKEVLKIAQLVYLELIMTGHVRLNQEQVWSRSNKTSQFLFRNILSKNKKRLSGYYVC